MATTTQEFDSAAGPPPDPRSHTVVPLALRRYGPGFGAVLLGVGASYTLNRLVPAVSALTLAVVLGALARNTGILGRRALPGVNVVTKRLLRAGVVLLGLQLAVGQIAQLDPGVLVVVVLTVSGTYVGTLLCGRLLGTSSGLTILVATGFAICGASAAAAMKSVDDSDEDDLATTIALVTIYGSGVIMLLPLLQQPLGLGSEAFGIWAGASVHEVAQVVATATMAGPVALGVATVVKLTRVVLLAPLVAGYGLVRRRRHSHTATGERPPLVPLFVLGFLAMVGVRSTGLLPSGVLDGAELLCTLLLAGALFGLGTSVHLPSLVRTGGRPLLLGAISTVLAATLSLTGIAVLPESG